MRPAALIGLVMFSLSIAVFGQDKMSCKAFFQVLQGDTQTPEGLRVGMDGAQKKWWEDKGQKEYPGLCLNGSVSSGDKPRYLVILSKSGPNGNTTVVPGEVYEQSAGALQNASAKEWIYKPRWDFASISILSVSFDGGLDTPPIHIAAGDRSYGWFLPNSPKVLKAAMQYLSQEEAFNSIGK